MSVDQRLFTEPVIIMIHGMTDTIFQDPGPGDSIMVIVLFMDGVLAGDMTGVGLIMGLGFMEAWDSDVAGGVLPFITRHIGVEFMAVQDLSGFMEDLSGYTIIFGSMAQIIYTETVAA